jgi:hypothetical protein
MTDQGLVAIIQPPLATDEQLRRHGLGIVPPQLLRDASKEGEGFDQAVQNGLGALHR